MSPIEQAQGNVIAWRDQVKAALISFERSRTINACGRLSIPTRKNAEEILHDARQVRNAAAMLEEAVADWIREQNPPLNVPGVTDQEIPFPSGT